VVDPVYGSSHAFELVAEREFGDDDGLTDEDLDAVFAHIHSRRGVAE